MAMKEPVYLGNVPKICTGMGGGAEKASPPTKTAKRNMAKCT